MNIRLLLWAAPSAVLFISITGASAVRAMPILTLTLDQGTQTVAPDTAFQFTGTVSSSFTDTLFLGGDSLNQVGSWPAGVTADSTPFLLNAPASLDPGVSYSGALFGVTAAPGTPAGSYAGTFQVEYDDSSGNPFLAQQGFQIIVAPTGAPVPEASSVISFGLLLALSGGAGAAAYKGKRRRGMPAEH